MKRFLAWLGQPATVRDLHVYGGLALAGVAGWMAFRWLALIVVGLVVAALGIFVPAAGGRPHPEETE